MALSNTAALSNMAALSNIAQSLDTDFRRYDVNVVALISTCHSVLDTESSGFKQYSCFE